MHCFNHLDTPAVGICRACSKGLCKDCATDLGHSLACKDKHIEVVESLNRLVTKNTEIQTINTKNRYLMPVFYGFTGLTFFLYGIFSKYPMGFATVLGAGFIVFAAFTLAISRQAWRK